MIKRVLRQSKLLAFGIAIGAVSMIIAACGGSAATPTPPAPTAAPTATPRPTQAPAATAAPVATATPIPTATAIPPTPTPPGPQPKYGGSLVTGSYTSPPATGNFRFYPNPARGTIASYWIPHNVQNNLVIFDPYQGSSVIKGDLAESWQFSSDGMTLTFKVRQGVTWQDGTPFTAKDVAYSINLILTPPQDWIANLRAVLAPKIAAVSAPDAQTVIFQLRQVSASVLARLTDYTLLIMPSHVDLEAMSKKPIGTGPYVFDSTSINVSSKVVRNPNYFLKDPAGRRLPFIDSQEWFQFGDPQSIVAAFRSGRLDYLNSFQGSAVLPQRRGIASSVPGAQFNEYLRAPEGWVVSNKPPLNDPRVREAMTLWVDRKEFVDVGFEGLGCWYDVGMLCEWQGGLWTLPAKEIMSRPGYRYLDKSGGLIDSYEKLVAKRGEMVKDPADRQRAKELLAQAGIKPGDVKITARVQQSQVRTGAPVFVAQMGDLFGATWTTDNEPSSQAFLQDLRGNNFSVYYSGFQAFGADDPELTLEQVYSASARYYGGFPPDQRFDQLFLAQDKELDPAKRKPIIQDLQRALIEARQQVILYNGGSATVSQRYVRDWPAANVNFNNTFRLERMWLDR